VVIRPPPYPSLGIDCITVLDGTSCAALKAARISWVVRYLDTLTPTELAAILDSGLGVSFCSYAPVGGWMPSIGRAEVSGRQALDRLQALKIPSGVVEWTDLEGVSSGAMPADIEAWGNTRAGVTAAAGYIPGLYVGEGGGLTGEELYGLAFRRYWRSLSDVPAPAPRGFCICQQYAAAPFVLGGVQVDVDSVQYDWMDNLPDMVWAE
jgi:hypothetical protein